MRASRLVALLLLLQQRGRLTAAQLAEALEVSVRTIYRDLEALSSAGVPVYAEPGRNGGCQLIDGYRTRLTGLNAKEAEALFAAGVSAPVGELGLGTVLGAAQLKLLAALPKDLAERASSARQRFHFDAPAWFRGARNEPHLETLASAVWDDRRVVVMYRHPGEPEVATRELEPFGLVCKAGVWYLVARRDGELRTYRVSRVEQVTLADETFRRPADFDLGAHWRQSVATYETQPRAYTVSLHASTRGLHALQRLGWPHLTEHDTRPDGRVACTVSFETADEAFRDLVRLGGEVVVEAPAALRARIVETAHAIAMQYA
jgi:predicted DNA-binding transcriptional regulator YafY